MKSTIKTIVLAAAGAALLAASPALAKAKRVTALQYNPPLAAQLYQEGAFAPARDVYAGGDTFGQIRDEYLKDAPSHNGNSY